jgi:hypothetical protein
VSDDATKRVLQAAFYPSESRQAVMTSLAAVRRTEGIPMALDTDRAHGAFHTPSAKGSVDKTQLTQVGRALARLGLEHIPSEDDVIFDRAATDSCVLLSADIRERKRAPTARDSKSRQPRRLRS